MTTVLFGKNTFLEFIEKDKHGITYAVNGDSKRTFKIPYSEWPEFKGATVKQLKNVNASWGVCCWHDLDIDQDLFYFTSRYTLKKTA